LTSTSPVLFLQLMLQPQECLQTSSAADDPGQKFDNGGTCFQLTAVMEGSRAEVRPYGIFHHPSLLRPSPLPVDARPSMAFLRILAHAHLRSQAAERERGQERAIPMPCHDAVMEHSQRCSASEGTNAPTGLGSQTSSSSWKEVKVFCGRLSSRWTLTGPTGDVTDVY